MDLNILRTLLDKILVQQSKIEEEIDNIRESFSTIDTTISQLEELLEESKRKRG